MTIINFKISVDLKTLLRGIFESGSPPSWAGFTEISPNCFKNPVPLRNISVLKFQCNSNKKVKVFMDNHIYIYIYIWDAEMKYHFRVLFFGM